eukprot:3930276-Prymnesium_polylepis.1
MGFEPAHEKFLVRSESGAKEAWLPKEIILQALALRRHNSGDDDDDDDDDDRVGHAGEEEEDTDGERGRA